MTDGEYYWLLAACILIGFMFGPWICILCVMALIALYIYLNHEEN